MPDPDRSLRDWMELALSRLNGGSRSTRQDFERMRRMDQERIRQTERAANPPMISTHRLVIDNHDGCGPQEFNGIASRYGRPTVSSDWRAELRVADIDVSMPNDARVADTGRKLCELCQIEGLRSFCEKCNKNTSAWYIGNSPNRLTGIYPTDSVTSLGGFPVYIQDSLNITEQTSPYIDALQESNEMLRGVDYSTQDNPLL